MSWTYVDDQLPKESGKYLVVATPIGNLASYESLSPFLTEWDKRTKRFAFDERMKQRKEIYRVYAWLAFLTPPRPRKESQ